MTKRIVISSLLSLTSVSLAVIHLFVHPLDNISLILLLVACMPWVLVVVKTVELPGGTKIELRDLVKIEKNAEDSGVQLPVPTLNSDMTPERTSPTSIAFLMSALEPNLALANLRIELEKRLRLLALEHEISKYTSVGSLLMMLRETGVLAPPEHALFADLLPVLNRAVHGEQVEAQVIEWAKDVGPRLIALLDKLLDQT